MKLIPSDTDLSGMDCHMHSPFSPDAAKCGAKPPEEIAAEVRKKGLRGFIITDHIDVGHWDGYVIDFNKYFDTWERVRENNPDLTIYIGLEVGFEAQYAEKTAELISDLPLEYVINSVHYWHDPKYAVPNFFNAKGDLWTLGRKKAYERYLACVLASLDCPYDFSTVGHLGFPERFAPYPEEERSLDYAMFKDMLDEIIKKAISRGARFEENTNSGGAMRLPREEFLRAYKAAGGTRPMLGSDAHLTDSVGQYFDVATKFLDGLFGKSDPKS